MPLYVGFPINQVVEEILDELNTQNVVFPDTYTDR